MRTSPKIRAEQLIDQAVVKLNEARQAADILSLIDSQADKFIVTSLLDLYIHNLNPSHIAEYANLRGKGNL